MPAELNAYLTEVASFADHWQSLIAGLLALTASIIVLLGVLSAAKRHVRAVERQTAAWREARAQAQERAENAVVWSLRSDAQRIEREALARKQALPSRPQFSIFKRTDVIIPRSPLLRGELPDVSLLSVELQGNLAVLSYWLNRFNAHVQTRPENADGVMADQELLTLLDRVIQSAGGLSWAHARSGTEARATRRGDEPSLPVSQDRDKGQ